MMWIVPKALAEEGLQVQESITKKNLDKALRDDFFSDRLAVSSSSTNRLMALQGISWLEDGYANLNTTYTSRKWTTRL